MAIEHVNIADADRHEPKGADSATVGQVYQSDGSGSGSWVTLDVVSYLDVVIEDVSTASSVLIPIPANCVVNSIKSVLGGPITVGDATITLTRGGDGLSLGTLVVANSGSAEGDVDVNTSLSNNNVSEGTNKFLKIATDGGSTDAAKLFVQIKVTI